MRLLRLGLTTVATITISITIVVVASGSASAHVTVDPSSAPAGGYGELTFRVPTESDSAATTKVQVFLPTDHPLAEVLVKPHPGWTFAVRTSKLATPITNDDGDQVTQAVSEIDWTASSPAEAVKPGEYDDFAVSTGPFPAGGTMTFKTLQTYSDGSVVRWIDTSESGEHPAPTLKLTPGGASTGSASATRSASGTVSASGTATKPASKTPLVLSILALVVAVAGAGTGLLRRRP